MTRPVQVTRRVDGIAAMKPAEDRPDDLQQLRPHQLGDQAAMEPAEDRPDDAVMRVVAGPGGVAAIEPAEDRRDDGSRNLSRLACANGAFCERPVLLRPKATSMELSRCENIL